VKELQKAVAAKDEALAEQARALTPHATLRSRFKRGHGACRLPARARFRRALRRWHSHTPADGISPHALTRIHARRAVSTHTSSLSASSVCAV
jgi:hypothetical protein